MKKLSILIVLIFLTAVAPNIRAQQAAPPGAGDKDLRDTNVKQRSVEMERIDREARKEDGESKDKKKKKSKNKEAVVQETPAPLKAVMDEVYPQIKEDYESMQNSQAVIMTTYGDGKNIDYAKISELSTTINKNAARLTTNLFPAPPAATADVKIEEKKETEKPITGKSLRSLLIELDDAVAAVISSPMFQNLRTVETGVGEKTKTDLRQVVRLTEAVNTEAAKNATKK